MRKIVIIQAWWKTIYKIIKIQKNIKKFLSKINLLNKRKEIEKLKNIKHKYLIRWLDITNKRIILKKLNIYNFERILKNKNNYKKIEPNKFKKKKINKERYNMDNFYKNNNTIDKKKVNYLSFLKNNNINSFNNQKLLINIANSSLLESNKNLLNRTNYVNISHSKNKSNYIFKMKSKRDNIINNSQEKGITKEKSKIIFFHKESKIQKLPFNLKNNIKKIPYENNKDNNSKKKNKSFNKDNMTNFKYNNNNYTLLEYQGYNTMNKGGLFNYKKKLNNLSNLKKYYECWKMQIIKIKTKRLIRYMLLKKSIIHFHFMIYGKSILEKLILYKKNKIIKDYFIHIKKRILISKIHSISVWIKLKKIFNNLKNKVFIIDLKNLLYNIKEIFYINDFDYLYDKNKNISLKKDNKIINNININNYYNNNFIYLNNIKYNNYLGKMNQIEIPYNIKLLKKNKSCEKNKENNLNNNIPTNIRQNNSIAKRFKKTEFKYIEEEMNILNSNKKNNIVSQHSFCVGNSNIVIPEVNIQYTKLNILLNIYSKFLRKRIMYNSIKIWKKNIINYNVDKKIINKKIKLNEKLLKMIKNSNNSIIQNENNNNNNKNTINNNSPYNTKNNKIVQNNINVYHKKKIFLNLDDSYYQGKNIITELSINKSINNNKNKNKYFLTEKNNSKLKNNMYASIEDNALLKNKIIEEKEIHFDKKIKRTLDNGKYI